LAKNGYDIFLGIILYKRSYSLKDGVIFSPFYLKIMP